MSSPFEQKPINKPITLIQKEPGHKTHNSALNENLAKFIYLFGPEHSFRLFNDKKDAPKCANVINRNTLNDPSFVLTLLKENQEKRGIFFTVNHGDFNGVKNENIVGIRYVWCEDDYTGYLRDDFPIKPNVIVCSSPGKYHYYWRFEEHTKFEEFQNMMDVMVSTWGSDPNAKDRSRVLRVPGFFHNKNDPHLVSVEYGDKNLTDWELFKSEFGYIEIDRTQRMHDIDATVDITPTLIRDLKAALKYIISDERSTWYEVGFALMTLGDTGYELWCEWSEGSHKYVEEDNYKWWYSGSNIPREGTSYKNIFVYAERYKVNSAQWNGIETGIVKTGKYIPIKWAIKGILLANNLTGLAGMQGDGKSTLTAYIAALISTGGVWPPTGEQIKQGRVLWITAEEVVNSEVLARFVACGGDKDMLDIMHPMMRIKNKNVMLASPCANMT
jgi:hypothetical protein